MHSVHKFFSKASLGHVRHLSNSHLHILCVELSIIYPFGQFSIHSPLYSFIYGVLSIQLFIQFSLVSHFFCSDFQFFEHEITLQFYSNFPIILLAAVSFIHTTTLIGTLSNILLYEVPLLSLNF